MTILAFDPSGSFKYGSGTTGWAIFENGVLISHGNIKAKSFLIRDDYFREHISLVDQITPDLIIVEDFILYKAKSNSLVNQQMETPELIGAICSHAFDKQIKVIRQTASAAKFIKNFQIEWIYLKNKNAWYSKITNKQISNHIIDAIRHGVLYYLKEAKHGAGSHDSSE